MRGLFSSPLSFLFIAIRSRSTPGITELQGYQCDDHEFGESVQMMLHYVSVGDLGNEALDGPFPR